MKARLGWLWVTIGFGLAGCSRSDPVVELWPGAPLASCQSTADCSGEQCVCGLCTQACGNGADCGEGQSCLGNGSLGFAATCGAAQAPAGVCLSRCAIDEQCAVDQQCLVGACVPTEQPELPEVVSAEIPEDAGVFLPPLGLGEPSFARDPAVNWLLDEEVVDTVSSSEFRESLGCPDESSCAPLQELLRTTDCPIVQAGCGLIQVSNDLFGAGTSRSWFDSFNSIPVGRRDENGRLLTRRDISCNQVEVVCSGCSYRSVVPLACENAPDFWPRQAALRLPAGCVCEPEGQRRSRVSLSCFCSSHDCPTLSDLMSACQNYGSDSIFQASPTFGCGLIWFRAQGVEGGKFGFDQSTGELVAAHHYTPAGPVAQPCNSFAVFSGRKTQCEESQYDFINDSSEQLPLQCFCYPGPDSCDNQPWYQALPGFEEIAQ